MGEGAHGNPPHGFGLMESGGGEGLGFEAVSGGSGPTFGLLHHQDQLL